MWPELLINVIFLHAEIERHDFVNGQYNFSHCRFFVDFYSLNNSSAGSRQLTGVTNLPGADLNAAGSGLAEARPMDGPSSEGSQRTCSLKYDGYITGHWVS